MMFSSKMQILTLIMAAAMAHDVEDTPVAGDRCMYPFSGKPMHGKPGCKFGNRDSWKVGDKVYPIICLHQTSHLCATCWRSQKGDQELPEPVVVQAPTLKGFCENWLGDNKHRGWHVEFPDCTNWTTNSS